MNNSRLGVALTLGLSLAAVGCEDSPARQAEKRVMVEVDRAERLCDRAESMLEDAVFKVDRDFAPLFNVLEDTTPTVTIDLEMVDQLNPKAVGALEAARKAIKGVVRETAADKGVLALANEALARVRAMQGGCADRNANVVRARIARTVAAVRSKILIARAHLGVQNFVDDLAGPGAQVAERIQKRLDEVKAEIVALRTRIRTQQTEADKQAALRTKLLAEATGLREEQRQLEQKESLAKGDERIVLIKQVEDKEIKAEGILVRVKGIEDLIADMKAADVRLNKVVEVAEVRQTMIQALADERKSAGDSHGTARKAEDNLLEAVLAQIGDGLKAVEKDWVELARLERGAQECYGDAADLLDKAQGLAGRSGASMPAKEGRAWIANARLDVVTLPQHHTNVLLGRTIENLWREVARRKRTGLGAAGAQEALPPQVKAALARITSLPSLDRKPGSEGDKAVSAADRKKAAAAKFRRAQRAFRTAVQRGRPPLMWVDRGHLALALYMAALCTEGPEASKSLKEAQDEIVDALKDKRESPHVRALLDIEKQLTFGDAAFLIVDAIDADGKMVVAEMSVAADGVVNGSFFKALDDGRTTKDLPGAVYVVGKDIQDAGGAVLHRAGAILLLVEGGRYMSPAEGLTLTIPAKMKIFERTYEARQELKVPSGARMPGAV